MCNARLGSNGANQLCTACLSDCQQGCLHGSYPVPLQKCSSYTTRVWSGKPKVGLLFLSGLTLGGPWPPLHSSGLSLIVVGG